MLLEKINSPKDLKLLSPKELPQLASEIREFIINTVSKTGGHLAPSLGVVDITICLHYCLNTPKDTIVWDVGHQAYAHKILTERKDKFHTLRQRNGLSGFPNATESEYDPFIVGHGSTSISTALGLAAARDLKGTDERIVAFIGDGSLGGGMAFEALNHTGQLQQDIIIILNDNEFSISHSVGAFSKYLNRVLTNPIYNKIRKQMQDVVKGIPKVGSAAFNAARRLEEALKTILVPGIIFEEMGIRHFGPVDGHDINALLETLKNVMPLKEPRMIHIITKKGKGYKFAEKDPSRFHGTAPFNIETGQPQKSTELTFTKAFSQKIVELAQQDEKIVAITAAMPEGTGLLDFKEKFPSRFFNVGMAEQHAIGFAAGMAKNGLTPIVCIYSTFLQRSYDQIFHDIALQGEHVVLCLDRAGIVGEDGVTHQGVFDIAYMRHLPNIVCMAPKDPQELATMLEFAVKELKGPVSIRYPRGGVKQEGVEQKNTCLPAGRENRIVLGKCDIVKAGTDVVLLAIGEMVYPALEAAHILSEEKISAEVVNMRFIKPLDEEFITALSKKVKHIITIEDNCVTGGFGSAVLEFLSKSETKDITVKTLGIPDEFIPHGKREALLSEYALDAKGIASSVKSLLPARPAGRQGAK